MYIAIANSILSSSNSGGAPVPTTERYYVLVCVGYGGNFISNDYLIGTFIADDRVTFFNGVDGFGVVQYVITMPSSGINIVETGINNINCFDNTISVPYSFEIINGYFIFDFNCTPDNNFSSEEGTYPMFLEYSIGIYVVYNDGESDTNFTLSGTLENDNYTVLGGGSFPLGIVQSLTSFPDISYYQIEYIITQPYFGNTQTYFNGNACNNSFMRTDKYTIFANFTNTEC